MLKTSDPAPRSARERVLAELERLELTAPVVEQETNGYTVLPEAQVTGATAITRGFGAACNTRLE